jgi:hypothetical protein
MTTKAAAAIHNSGAIQSSTAITMRKDEIIYWTTTGIVVAVMVWSAINFAVNPAMKGAFAHLGLPNWFRIELTTAKMIGALALVIPAVPAKIKEFAYFGFAITLVSAAVAHLSSGDSIYYEIGHSTFFISLVLSYVYHQKRVRRERATS